MRREIQTTQLVERREYIRERPIALRNTATTWRRKALACATAVVAGHRPHRDSRDVVVCIRKVQKRLRIAQLKDLGVGVVNADHRSHPDTRGQAGRNYLVMSVARGLLSAESHLTSVIVGRTVVHGHDVYYVQAEPSSFHAV